MSSRETTNSKRETTATTNSKSACNTTNSKKSFQTKLSEVAQIAEERRRERMKGLTRNLEVCDLLDMRNVQCVAEHAPKITAYLLENEKEHQLPDTFMKN